MGVEHRIRTISEDQGRDVLVGAPIQVSDQEVAAGIQTLEFEIASGNAFNAFSIDNSGQLRLENSLGLNFENQKSFSLTVAVRDPMKLTSPVIPDTPIVVSKVFIVGITDINESPAIVGGYQLVGNFENVNANYAGAKMYGISGDQGCFRVCAGCAYFSVAENGGCVCHQDLPLASLSMACAVGVQGTSCDAVYKTAFITTPAAHPGHYDLGIGGCVQTNGKAVGGFGCEGSFCLYEPDKCASLCEVDDDCAGFMMINQPNSDPTCAIVSAREPDVPGT